LSSDFNDMAKGKSQGEVRKSITDQLKVVDVREQAPPTEWRTKLQKNDRSAILPNAFNIKLILENDAAWKGVLQHCNFSYRILKARAPDIPEFEAGEWSDADTARLNIWLIEHYRITPTRQSVSDALLAASHANGFHPVRKYLDGLTWDKIPRLDYWLTMYLGAGAADEDYLALAGRYFLIESVARIYQPGCKADTVLILEGKQGAGKSSAVHVLFGDWFSDAPVPIGDKDAYQNITGVWGQEMAELDSFNKAENTAAKMFFSQRRDRYRRSYGTHAEDFPRQCVFIGTTNQDEYLKDYTGNRRYWPVLCFKIKTAELAAVRDQLWAEAVARFRDGERWWAHGDVELAYFDLEQDKRMQADPWENMLADYLDTMTAEHFSADELLKDCIGLDGGHMQRAHQNRLSPIMKSLGWHSQRKRISVVGKIKQRRVYVRPNVVQ